jgi:hypothetical protein
MWFYRDRPVQWQRWLARVPVGTQIPCPDAIAERIRAQVLRQPFCFKDPRFSYTLPAWRPHLNDTVYICVFRNPASTVKSILKECRDADYLRSLRISGAMAMETWTLMYRSIIEIHSLKGEWLFLHYDQVVDADGLNRLEEFVDAPVDRNFPEKSLRRSTSDHDVPKDAQRIYEELCIRARYYSDVMSSV